MVCSLNFHSCLLRMQSTTIKMDNHNTEYIRPLISWYHKQSLRPFFFIVTVILETAWREIININQNCLITIAFNRAVDQPKNYEHSYKKVMNYQPNWITLEHVPLFCYCHHVTAVSPAHPRTEAIEFFYNPFYN